MATTNVIVNNTNMDKISQTIENGKKDKTTLRKPVNLQGQWNLGSKYRISV